MNKKNILKWLKWEVIIMILLAAILKIGLDLCGVAESPQSIGTVLALSFTLNDKIIAVIAAL